MSLIRITTENAKFLFEMVDFIVKRLFLFVIVPCSILRGIHVSKSVVSELEQGRFFVELHYEM